MFPVVTDNIDTKLDKLTEEFEKLKTEFSDTGHGAIINHGKRLEVDKSMRLTDIGKDISSAIDAHNSFYNHSDLPGWEDLGDPDGDRIVFWDDSEGILDWLNVGDSLAFSAKVLDTIQDIRTTASPTFANLALGTGELTTGSINRVSGSLTLEVAGTPIVTCAAGAVTMAQTVILSDCVNAAADVDAFLVRDLAGNVDFRTGAEVLSDIGGSPTIHRHDTETLQHDAVNSDGGAFSFTTSGILTFSNTVALTTCINAAADVDKFLVLDGGNNIDFRTGAEVLSDIGASPTTHRHDGHTMQFDAVNSDGGAFSFTTTGLVTFNQEINAVDLTLTNFASGSETIDEILDDTINPGILDAITITDEGGINISWTAGEVWDYDNCDIVVTDASGAVACTDNVNNYLYWDRSGGGTALTLSTVRWDINDNDIPIAIISVQNADLWGIRQVDLLNTSSYRTTNAIEEILKVVVTEGLVVSEDVNVVNDLDVQISAGTFYNFGNARYNLAAGFNTRTTAMTRWFHTGGAWDYDSNAEIDPTQYDDLTDLAATNAAKYYKSVFMYSENMIHWMYPQVAYNTLAQAIAAPLPIIPAVGTHYPYSVAVVMKGSDTTFPTAGGERWIDVRPQFGTSIAGSISDHSSLVKLNWADAGHSFDAAVDFNAQNISNIGTVGCGAITVADGSSINLQEDITFTGATTENKTLFPDHLANAYWLGEGANAYLTFKTTNSAEAVIISKNLGVGISTPVSNPSGRLAIHLEDTTNDVQFRMVASNNVEFTADLVGSTGIVQFGTRSNHGWRFITNSSAKMYLSATGLFGINQSSPQRELHVTRAVTGNTVYHCSIFEVKTTANMTDNFGVMQEFRATDSGVGQTVFGRVGFQRDGADNQGKYIIRPAQTGGGITTTGFYVDHLNNVYVAGKLGIGAAPLSNECDVGCLKDGVLAMTETTTPTADANYGKLYTKNDNVLYFQDGAGAEHALAYV